MEDAFVKRSNCHEFMANTQIKSIIFPSIVIGMMLSCTLQYTESTGYNSAPLNFLQQGFGIEN